MLKSLKKLFLDPQFSRKKSFLKSLVLFQDLGDRDLGVLAKALHSRTYHAGEVVFKEGDIGRALFILESGKVTLSRASGDGASQVIHTLQPGEFFGEMALLEQLPRTASAEAAERCQIMLLYKSRMEALLHGQPRIGVAVMSRLAQLLSARLRRISSASPAAASQLNA